MESTYIWIINYGKVDSFIELEIFVGRNKFTKVGLFSGPLRRQDIGAFTDDKIVQFMFSLSNIVQIGKNKFRLPCREAACLFEHFQMCSVDSVYCRLSDKKLHHINTFVSLKYTDTNISFCEFDSKSGTLSFSQIEAATTAKNTRSIVTIKPVANLYLDSGENEIRGYLFFSYCGIDVQANSARETIELSSQTILRNLLYERNIQEQLYSLKGRQSLRNEIVFPKKQFFSTIFPELCATEVALFWGKEKQRVSKSTISCSISYDMDWFLISGEVIGDRATYKLSDLLRASRGKSYIEIDGEILFLPEELRKLASYPTENDCICVNAGRLAEVNQIADRFKIDPSTYLDGFLNFSDCKCTVSSQLDNVLKPYQKIGASWILTLYKNRVGGCLADDMGLGKTVQAIAFISCKERRTELPILIVVPKVVLYNWKNELSRFAPEIKVTLAYGKFDYSDIREINGVYLTTYETLLNHNADFEYTSFDAVILDESQYVKNYKTKRYQAIKKIKSNFILALTGTPIENSVEELWSLFNLLNPGLLGNHSAFMSKFADAHIRKETLETLRKIVSPFILRRTKDAVLDDLPAKQEHYIYCEMDHPQRTLYDTLLVAAQNELNEKPSQYVIKDNAAILQALLYLREVCSEPQLLPQNLKSTVPCESCKFELFKEYARRIMVESGKIIVYSLFPRVLHKLEAWCVQQGWNTFYIDGTTNNRQSIADEFEHAIQGIFLISLKAGGVGLNLVSCQYVFIYEPWWNSAAEQQAANRIYRIGQNKPVFIYHFLVKGTIEEKIHELQKKKEYVSSGILDRLDQPEKASIKDIYRLLF